MMSTSHQELGLLMMADVFKPAVCDCFPVLCDFVSRHRLLVRVTTCVKTVCTTGTGIMLDCC